MAKKQSAALERKKFFSDPILISMIVVLLVFLALFILYPLLMLLVDSFLEEKDKYASFLGGNTPLYIIRNPAAASEEKLLVVRDSYSDAMAPFLSQYFAEIHLVDLRYYRTSVVEYARENGMDRIFVCYSVENFVKDLDAVFMGR